MARRPNHDKVARAKVVRAQRGVVCSEARVMAIVKQPLPNSPQFWTLDHTRRRRRRVRQVEPKSRARLEALKVPPC